MFHYISDDHHRNRQDQKRSQSHPYIDRQHHDKYADQGGHRCDHLSKALVNAGLKGIHIIGDPGKDLTVSLGLIVFQRKPVQLSGNIFSQIIGHIVRDP